MTTILVTMIVITISLTVAFANTQSFPSALNKTEGNMARRKKILLMIVTIVVESMLQKGMKVEKFQALTIGVRLVFANSF